MIKNRSVPTDRLLPQFVYMNVADALDWLAATFGFIENFRYGETDGQTQGAQMHLGEAWIMLSSARPGRVSPLVIGQRTQLLAVCVEDVDLHFERTKLAGATIVEELHETIYGERQYAAEDLEGHHWIFSKHVRDVDPEEWGATKSIHSNVAQG